MGLKRWNGSAYVDVSPTRWRGAGQYVDRSPKHAYVWDGSKYVLVWPSMPPLAYSKPDYWFSLEDGVHEYNRGSKSTPLTYNSAGRFANRGDHVYVNGAEARINTTEPWNGFFTVASWFENTGNPSTTEYLWARGNASTGTAIYVLTPSADKTKIGIRIDDGSTLSGWVYTDVNVVPQPGSGWFHFAMTSELVDNRNLFRIYINGIEIYSGWFVATYAPLSFGPTEWTSIGNVSTDSLYPWEGNVDDMAIWSRTLSPAEVSQIAEAGRSSPPIIPVILTETLPAMTVNTAYSFLLQTNLSSPSWSATGLPAGISLNSSTGQLSGTPTTASSGSISITATGSEGSAYATYSWTVLPDTINFYSPFNSDADTDYYFPIQGFDSRTSSSSPQNKGWVYSGMLVAGDNSAATYWDLLHDKPAKGDLDITLLTGDVVSSSNPLGLIISSDSNLTYQIILEIKNNNLRLVRRTTGAVTQIRSFNTTDGGVRKPVRVVRSGTNISVYANGSLKFTNDLSSYAYWNRANGGYVGLSMYSTSSAWCGRVDSYSAQSF